MKVADLRAECKKRNYKGYSSANKTVLEYMLENDGKKPVIEKTPYQVEQKKPKKLSPPEVNLWHQYNNAGETFLMAETFKKLPEEFQEGLYRYMEMPFHCEIAKKRFAEMKELINIL